MEKLAGHFSVNRFPYVISRGLRDIAMRKSLPLVMAIASLLLFSFARAQEQAKKKPLDIDFLDTEGGQATLFVSPSGESLLVDTGFPGNQGALLAQANTHGVTRDADRIMSVLKRANVNVLDYVVITHYHADHAGNAAELARRIPIRHFVDHGPYTVEMQAGRDAAYFQRGFGGELFFGHSVSSMCP
jgi:beta-lactamase superfamily II metal-dependent hydrolase